MRFLDSRYCSFRESLDKVCCGFKIQLLSYPSLYIIFCILYIGAFFYFSDRCRFFLKSQDAKCSIVLYNNTDQGLLHDMY